MRRQERSSTSRQPPDDFRVQSEDALNLFDVLSPSLRATHSNTAKDFTAADAAVDRLFSKVVAKLLPDLQRHLDTLEGKDFGREANASLARNLNRILKRLSCCVACAKCGEPTSAIRYVDMSRGGSWLWRFEHTPSRRHGGTVAIPPLQLRIKTTPGT